MAGRVKRSAHGPTATVPVLELALPSSSTALVGIPGEPIRDAHTLLFSQDGIFISDELNHRILRFERGGQLLWTAGGKGSESGSFLYPRGMAFFKGMLWVCDSLNGRIQVFGTDGRLIKQIGGSSSSLRLHSPICISVAENYLFIVDRGDDSVVIADEEGREITRWTARAAPKEVGERISIDEAVHSVRALTAGFSPAFEWKGLKQLAFSDNRIWCLGNDRLTVHDGCGQLVAHQPLQHLTAERGLVVAGGAAFFLDERSGGLVCCRPDGGCVLFRGKELLLACGIAEGRLAVITPDQRLSLIKPDDLIEAAAAACAGRVAVEGTAAARLHLAAGDADRAAAELDELLATDAIGDPEREHDLINWRFHQPDSGGKVAIAGMAANRLLHAAEEIEALAASFQERTNLYSTLLDSRYTYLTAVPYRGATLPGWLMNRESAERAERFYALMRSMRHCQGLLIESLPHLVNTGDEGAGGIAMHVFDALKVILRAVESAASIRKDAQEECTATATALPRERDGLRTFCDDCARFTIADQFLMFISRLLPEIMKAVPKPLRNRMPTELRNVLQEAWRLSCSVRDLLIHGDSLRTMEGPLGRKPPAAGNEAAQIADLIVEVCSRAEEVYHAKRPADIDASPLVAAAWNHIALSDRLRSQGKLFAPELVKLTAREGIAQLRNLGMAERVAALEEFLTDKLEPVAKPRTATIEGLHETLGPRIARLVDGREGLDLFAEELAKAAPPELFNALTDLAFVLPFDGHQALLLRQFEQAKSLPRGIRTRISALGSALATHAGEGEQAAKWRKQALQKDHLIALEHLGSSLLSLGHREQAGREFSRLFEVTRAPLAGLAVTLTKDDPSLEDLKLYFKLQRHHLTPNELYELFNRAADDWRVLEVIREEILARATLTNPDDFGSAKTDLENLGRFGGFPKLDAVYSKWMARMPDFPGLPLMRARNQTALGDPEGALEVLDELHCRFEPTMPSLELAATCAMQAGKPYKSEELTKRQIALGKHPDSLALRRASLCIWQGKPDAALEQLGKVAPGSPLTAQRADVENSIRLILCDFTSIADSSLAEALTFGRNSFRLWSYLLSSLYLGRDEGYAGGLASLAGLRELHVHRIAGEALGFLRAGDDDAGRRLAWAALHRSPGLGTFLLAPPLLDSLDRKPMSVGEGLCLASLAERFPLMKRVAAFAEVVRLWNEKPDWQTLLPADYQAADREEAFRNSLLGKLALRHDEPELALKLLEPLGNRFGFPEVEGELAEARKRLRGHEQS